MGKLDGLLFGSVWANGKQISVLGKFRSGLALTICRNPYHSQKKFAQQRWLTRRSQNKSFD